MKGVVGLVGGMGWPSTALYYERLNRLVEPDTVHIVISSLRFTELLELASRDRFDLIAEAITAEARRLETAGATALALCAATAHLTFDAMSAATSVPCVHIAEPFQRPDEIFPPHAVIGMLGTVQTLDNRVFEAPLAKTGRQVLRPGADELADLDRCIKGKIAAGHHKEAVLEPVQTALDALVARGATHIVLACTELPLVRDMLRSPVPLVDAVELHCRAILHQILISR